jgi:hypothetical protein
MMAKVCTRAVVLHQGRLVFDGETGEATDRLRALMGTAERQLDPETGGAGLRITDARVADPATRVERLDFWVGDPLAVEVDLAVAPGAPPAELRVVVTGPADYPMYAMQTEPIPLDPDAAVQTVRLAIPAIPALQGVFSLAVAVMQPGTRVAIDARRFGERIRVFGPIDYGLVPVEFTADVLDTPPPPRPERDQGEDEARIKAKLAAARGSRTGGGR